MMRSRSIRWLMPLLFVLSLSACARPPVRMPDFDVLRPPPAQARPSPPVHAPKRAVVPTPGVAMPKDPGWTLRVVKEQELLALQQKDPALTVDVAWNILARLNTKAYYYIVDDIKAERPLKVPNDFRAYKNWTPMPGMVSEAAGVAKLIIVLKDIPFMGWYERGRLKGDTLICIGAEDHRTDAGLYQIKDKDEDHVSSSYPNAFGQPSPMPWGLRVYDAVWIHGGDITEGFCSHGCINVPLHTAKTIYHWADLDTLVLIVESKNTLLAELARYAPGFIPKDQTLPDPRTRTPGNR